MRELWNEHRAYVERITREAQRESERDLVLAWQIERMSILAVLKDGGRKTPDVRKLLKEMRDGRTGGGKQTPTEQFAVIHALKASTGVPLQRLKKGPDGKYRRIKN